MMNNSREGFQRMVLRVKQSAGSSQRQPPQRIFLGIRLKTAFSRSRPDCLKMENET